MERRELRPVYVVYPGLYPLLMVNYWVRRRKTPIIAIILSGYEIKFKGKYLNFLQVVLGMVQTTGWRYTIYMLLIAKFAVPVVSLWNWIRRLMGKPVKIKTYQEIADENGIPLWRTKDFNSDEMKSFLRNVKANLIVSAYNNQILKRRIFNVPEFGGVNIHPALLPNFRGLDGPFEAMYHGVKTAGVTIHIIDSRIDTGRILCQEPIRIKRADTLFSLSVRCWMHGAKVLEKVFDMFRSGKVNAWKQNPRDIRFPYRSFPEKQRIKEFHAQGRKLFRWLDLVNTLKD